MSSKGNDDKSQSRRNTKARGDGSQVPKSRSVRSKSLFRRNLVVTNASEEYPELSQVRLKQRRMKRITYLETMKDLEALGRSQEPPEDPLRPLPPKRNLPRDEWDSLFLLGYKNALTYSMDIKVPYVYVPTAATRLMTTPLTKWQRWKRHLSLKCQVGGSRKHLADFEEGSDLVKRDSLVRLRRRSDEEKRLYRREYGLDKWRMMMDSVVLEICPRDRQRIDLRRPNYI